MITIQSAPDANLHLAINDEGATWGILPDGNSFKTQASKASVKFTVSTGTPTVGSFITVFGQKFTVSTTNSYNTFIFNSTTVATTINNIIAALNANYDIAGNFTTSIIGGEVIITWFKKGYHEDFTFSGFAQCVASLQTQGTDSILLDDYGILFEGIDTRHEGIDTRLISPFTGVKLTDAIIVYDALVQTPINLNRYLKHLIWNDLDRDILFSSNFHFDSGGWAKIKLKVGETQRISGAIVQTDIKYSSEYRVINARLKEDELNLSPYETGEAKFLNQRPNNYIFNDEYAVLYFLIPYAYQTGTYRILFDGMRNNGSTFSNYMTATIDSTTCILIVPCSPANNTVYIPSDAKSYTVKVVNYALSGFTQISETKTFEVTDCDCCKEDIYFLSEKGAFDTLRVQRIENKSISVSQTEILKDVVALAGVQTLEQKLMGNVKQINTSSQETIVFTTEEVMMNEKELDYFRQFKQSERRYLKKEVNGQLYAVPFIVEPSETTVYQFGDTIRLQITGYLGNGQFL